MEYYYRNGDNTFHAQQLQPLNDYLSPMASTTTTTDTNPVLMKYLLSSSSSNESPCSPVNSLTSGCKSGRSFRSNDSCSQRGIRRFPGPPASMSALTLLENVDVSPLSSSLASPAMKVEEDVLVMDDVLVGLVTPGSRRSRSSADGFSSLPSPESSTLYKTEMCRQWEDTGTCLYGVKCQLARGKEELRPTRVTHVFTKSKSELNLFKTNLSASLCSPENRFALKAATPSIKEKAGALAASAFSAMAATELKQPPVSRLSFSRRNWCPLHDGIEISLPYLAGIQPSEEDVNCYIDSILYGQAQKKRLPVFSAICPH